MFEDIVFAASSEKKATIETTNIRCSNEKFIRFQEDCLGFKLLGHTEELETKFTFNSKESGGCTPIRMSPNLKQAICVAFNNFDWIVENLTGKDTPHDAGIAYQYSIQKLHPCLNNSTDTSSVDLK